MDFNKFVNGVQKILETDLFAPATSEEVQSRHEAYAAIKAKEERERAKQRALELVGRREKTQRYLDALPYTYEDIITLPIYKKILDLGQVTDITSNLLKNRRSLHMQIIFGNSQRETGVKDYYIQQRGNIYSPTPSTVSTYTHRFRIEQCWPAETLADYAKLLEDFYKIAVRKIAKESSAVSESNIFKPASEEEVVTRRNEHYLKTYAPGTRVVCGCGGGETGVIDHVHLGQGGKATMCIKRDDNQRGVGCNGLWSAYLDGTFWQVVPPTINGATVNESDLFKPATSEEATQRRDSYFSAWAKKCPVGTRVVATNVDGLTPPQFGTVEHIHADRHVACIRRDVPFRGGGCDGLWNVWPAEDIWRPVANEVDGAAITNESKISEADDIFKPATPEDVAKRQGEYLKTLEPEIKKLRDLVIRVRELEMRYQKFTDGEYAHYGKVDSYGFPESVSFNIKLTNHESLAGVQDKLDSNGLEDAAQGYIYNFINNNLTSFGDSLYVYSFVDNWRQEGRSGGWLVVDLRPLKDEETIVDLQLLFSSDHIDAFPSPSIDVTDWLTPSTFSMITQYIRQLTTRIEGLDDIQTRVTKGKNDLERTLQSPKFWDKFFKQMEDV